MVFYATCISLRVKLITKYTIQSLKDAKTLKNEQFAKNDSSLWEFAGPLNIGGRLTDVEMHPSDMQTIYAATASGGIFKSVNTGESWVPIFDDALSLSLEI